MCILNIPMKESKKERKKEEENQVVAALSTERTLSYINNNGNIVGRNINDKRDF